jgi:uncharacterized LabA/DUF88 family protein
LRLLALLDHKNVPWASISLADALGKALTPLARGAQIDVDLRAYGGWFEGDSASSERFSASALYQADLPSLIRIDEAFVRIHFEFAEYLLQQLPGGIGIPIHHTVVTRASAELAVPRKKNPVTCSDPGCEIRKVRRWISRKSACVKPGCSHLFSEFWERKEQKQVDCHIAADLLVASNQGHYDGFVLISDDIDFVPALAATALARRKPNLACLRFSPPAPYMSATLNALGIKLVIY